MLDKVEQSIKDHSLLEKRRITVRRSIKPRLAIFVPTFRRPVQLVQTLQSLAQQDIEEPFLIAVGDNDAPSRDGESAAKRWAEAQGFPDRLLTVVVPERGISHCRNTGLSTILNTCLSVDFIAMVDDDARANSAWLRNLVEVQRKFNVDLVGGPVIYEFPTGSPEWLRRAATFRTAEYDTGYVERLRGSGNCLLTRSLLKEVMPRPFDDRFGLIGSEDVDFFERCSRLGAKSAWAADALVFEMVPPERLSRDWILRKMKCVGHSQFMISIKYDPNLSTYLAQLLLIARGLMVGFIRLFAFFDKGKRLTGNINIAQSLVGSPPCEERKLLSMAIQRRSKYAWNPPKHSFSESRERQASL